MYCIDQLNEIIENQKSEFPDLRSMVLLSGQCSESSKLQIVSGVTCVSAALQAEAAFAPVGGILKKSA
jgi:hypothetical protein